MLENQEFGGGKEMPYRKLKAVSVLALLLLVAATAVFVWPEHTDQKVRHLLHEMRDVPTGKAALFYFGRSYAAIETDFDRLGPRAVPGLINGLDDPSQMVRYLVAGQLGRIGDRRAVARLIASLSDPDNIVRYWAGSHQCRLSLRERTPFRGSERRR